MSESTFSNSSRIDKLKKQLSLNRAAMEFLQKFSEGLLAISDQQQLFRFCNICAAEFLNLDFATLLLWIPEKKSLLIKDTVGFPEEIIDSYSLKEGEGLAHYCFSKGRTAAVVDFKTETRFRVPDIVYEFNIRSAIAVPMLRESEVAGVMIGHTKGKRCFDALEKSVFQAIACQSAVAIHCQIHQQKRKETEERYSRIFNMVQEALFIHDAHTGQILETNNAASNLFGISQEELLQSTPEDFSSGIHPYTSEEALKKIHSVMEKGPQTFRWHSKRCDGSLFWSEISLSPVNIGGKDRVIAVVRDLTHRLAREKDIARKAAELEAIFNSIRDIVVFMDTNRRILKVNPLALELTGFSLKEVIGRSTKNFYVNPADHSRIQELFFTPDGPQATKPFTTLLKKKDGSRLPVEVMGGPVKSKNGELLGYLGVARDISERIAMERQIQHVQKLESLGVLAGGIAHDFNNILLAVLGNADLALEKLPKDSAAIENLRAIVSAAHKASDLCRQMLAFSGRGKFLTQNLDLNTMVKEIHNMLKMSINKKSSLRLELCELPTNVKGDPSQLQQVIMNLIINASEAMDNKSGIITISTGYMSLHGEEIHSFTGSEKLWPGTYCFLQVSDTGCGMDERTRLKVFDPFFTTKFTGRGLGMAAVLGIIKGHHGGIRIQSARGKGTTVTIILPQGDKGLEKAPNNKFTQGDSELLRGVVLLVDDELTVREVGTQMLEYLGFSVVTAENGQEAIDVFKKRREQLDVIIMDLTMPEMDGLEASKHILQIDDKTKILISSGYDGDEVNRASSSLDISGFIHKPYKLSSLRKKMIEILGKGERSSG